MLGLKTSEERQDAQRYLKYLLGDSYEPDTYRITSMLFGTNKDDKVVNIKDAKKGSKYTCPVCKRPLNIANGPKNRKHFRHEDKDDKNNVRCLEYSPIRLVDEDLTKAIKERLKHKEDLFCNQRNDKYCTSFNKISLLTGIKSVWLEKLYKNRVIEKEYEGKPSNRLRGVGLSKKGQAVYEELTKKW